MYFLGRNSAEVGSSRLRFPVSASKSSSRLWNFLRLSAERFLIVEILFIFLSWLLLGFFYADLSTSLAETGVTT